MGRLAPTPSHPQPHQGATGSGQEMILRPQSSPGNVGNGKAKLSPRGKSRGRHRGKGVARQRWGLGPELWGHTGCLLRRGTDTGQAPHHTIPGADRVARNTHTHTHARTRFLISQTTWSSSPEAAQRASPLPNPCLAWTIEWPRKHLALREASWDLVVGRVLSTAPQPGTGWPMARALDLSQLGCPGLSPPCSPRPPWLHPS